MEPQAQSYHHGNLRQALIDAARDIIEEVGPEGFSLRAAARRAGVSAAAPAHHFSSVRALLTAVAERGFCELGAILDAEPVNECEVSELHAIATRYVRFASAHPGLFRLMFREGLADRADPMLREASQKGMYRISYALAGYQRIPLRAQMDSARHPVILGMWASLHGLAHLAVEGAVIYTDGENGVESRRPIVELLPAILADQWPGRGQRGA